MTSPIPTELRSSPPLLTITRPQPSSSEDLPAVHVSSTIGTANATTGTEHQLQYIHPSLQDNPYAKEPTYFTRPNRYFGPTSTWRTWTQADRAVVTSLDRIRSQDLSIHLFNSFVLRKRNAVRRSETASRRRKTEKDRKGKGKVIDLQTHDDNGGDDHRKKFGEDDEAGELVDLPRAWSSWPLPPDIVPREDFLPMLSEKEAWRREKDTRPSAVLEECLIASTTKFAKDMWDARVCEGGYSPRSTHSEYEEDRSRSRSGDGGRQSQRPAAENDREPKEPQYFSSQVFTRDESSSASSSASSSSSSIESTSGDEENDDDDEEGSDADKEVVDHEDENGESDEDEEESDDAANEDEDEFSNNSDSASSVDTEDSHQGKPIFMADDDKARQLLLPSTRHIISKLDNLLAALHKARAAYAYGQNERRKRKRRTEGDQAYSTETENFTTTDIEIDTGKSRQSSPLLSANSSMSRAKSRLKRRQELAPRDWSDVIGLAAITGGFSQQTIQRASERCARLFEENMLLRTFHEGDEAAGLEATRESEGPWFEEGLIIGEDEEDKEAGEEDVIADREEDGMETEPDEDIYVTARRSSAACTRCHKRRERCIPPKRLPTNTPNNSTVSCVKCLSSSSTTCSGITIAIKHTKPSLSGFTSQSSQQTTCPHPTCERHNIAFANRSALTQHIKTTHNGIKTPPTSTHNLNRKVPTLKRSFSSISISKSRSASANTTSDAAASSPMLASTNQEIYCPIPTCYRSNTQAAAQPFTRGYRLYEHIRTRHPTVDVKDVKQMEKQRRGENRGRWNDSRRRNRRKGSESEKDRGRSLDKQDKHNDDNDGNGREARRDDINDRDGDEHGDEDGDGNRDRDEDEDGDEDMNTNLNDDNQHSTRNQDTQEDSEESDEREVDNPENKHAEARHIGDGGSAGDGSASGDGVNNIDVQSDPRQHNNNNTHNRNDDEPEDEGYEDEITTSDGEY